ncbi:inner nuclear membrane protein enriched at telomere/subtelomere region [Geranomyces variabilis]|uniref:Inner nuclear membrane protein enriched at telomere/subtelomere region n=1 Tax=Geranomyces variabilis TaxID=109894 RepID=A0AAD5TGX8_9FUNG|nr:inner nuclear membrane protein enriched at telomere/subtelomere region [Geranomyces variabilis]
MADNDYLAEGFDPHSLKVAQLKSILGKHGVTTPTSQKKKEVYVDLFNTQITPFRDRFAKEATKSYGKPPKSFGNGEEEPESRDDPQAGIFDSGQGSSANVSSAAPTPAAVRKRRGVAAAASGSSDDAQPAAQSPAEVLPHDDKNPFSEDNVFQTSPTRPVVTKTPKKSPARRPQSELPAGSSSSLANILDYGQDSEEVSAPSTPVKKPVKRKSRAATTSAAVASPQPFSFKNSFARSMPDEEEDDDVEKIRPTTPVRTSTRRKTSATSGLASPVKKTPAAKRKIVGSSLRPQVGTGDGGSEEDLIPVKRKTRSSKSKAMPEYQESSSDLPADEKSDEEATASGHYQSVPQKAPASPASEEDEFVPAETGSPATEAWSTVTPKKPTPPPTVGSAMSPPRVTSTHKYRRPTTALPRGQSDSWNVALLLVVLVASAFGMWYWEQKDVLEFCDPAKTAPAPYAGYNPLGYILPTCKKCPDNAVCVGQTVLSCESGDYIAKPDKITSLAPWAAPALPFFVAHPTCVLDTRKQQEDLKRARNVHMLLELLETTVRHWIGRTECGGLDHAVGEDLRDPTTGRILGMPTETARKELHKLVEKKWNSERFKTFWSLAMEEIRTPHRYAPAGDDDDVSRVPTPDIVERFDRSNFTRILIPAKPPIMPLACRLRRSIWETCRAYWMQLSSLGITVLFFVWFSYKRQNIAREARIVARVLDDVVDAASEEADAFATDPLRHPIPGLRIDQLRDYYLPAHAATATAGGATSNNDDYRHPEGAAVDDHGRMRFHIPDDAARTRIWDAVAALVQRNSSMKETVMDVQGQSHEVWQWIGSHALSPRAAKKTSTRVLGDPAAVKKLDFGAVAGKSSSSGSGGSGGGSAAGEGLAPAPPASSLYPESP